MCGCDGLPTPRTNVEVYLHELAKKLEGGGSSGGGGADGRGLKVLEAATIEELYNKVLALDNPVLFKVTTDNSFNFHRDNGALTTGSFTLGSSAAIITAFDLQILAITDYDYENDRAIRGLVARNGDEVSLVITIENDTKVENCGFADLSNVTKFTAYYF